jgi:hypothetical protein
VPYTAEISRANPTAFVFLVDQSASMGELFGTNSRRSKAAGTANAINRLLQELSIKCAKDGGVRDYFHVGVIGYGTSVAPMLGGPMEGRDLVPISEIAMNPLRVEERVRHEDDGFGGLRERKVKFPVWFEPRAKGRTPMSEALARAKEIVADWLVHHPGCFPPVVINITDGESTDGDPTGIAEEIKCQTSADGPALLLNAHLCSRQAQPISFPDSPRRLLTDQARLLFRMSSRLPQYMRELLADEGHRTSEETRGFVYNADIVEIVSFLNIGTRTNELR